MAAEPSDADILEWPMDDQERQHLPEIAEVTAALQGASVINIHKVMRSLQPLFDRQREFASAIEAAGRAQIVAASQLDMTGIRASLAAVAANSTSIESAHRHWVETLTRSINLDAIRATNAAVLLASASDVLNDQTRRSLHELVARIDFTAISRAVGELRNSSFTAHTLDRFIGFLPANLRRCDRLDEVASISLNEGIPFCWVIRPRIVEELLDADDARARYAILEHRRDEILEDCRGALDGTEGQWVNHSLEAIAVLVSGYPSAAQSHAANVVDGIVRTVNAPTRREDMATASILDLPFAVVSEGLTLHPLARAYACWFPNTNEPIPETFARHATVHAVGHDGVFKPLNALIAVMLATSLTRQFSRRLSAPFAEGLVPR